MRYDVPIYFQKNKEAAYDPNTGDYEEASVIENLRYASVMDTTTQMIQIVYGRIKQGSLTIHLQNHYDYQFDQIRIGQKIYKVDYSRRLRNKQTYIVSEVQ